jgi:flagellar hook assembly protein FlgD
MMIDATGANLAAPTRSTGNNESLDQAAFLRLMSAQLQAQDPFEPIKRRWSRKWRNFLKSRAQPK